MEKKENGYKDTLNLPRTKFSMKANLSQKEPETLRKWAELNIYSRIIKKRVNAKKTFILHDGPPYANGHIHMGHVLNKILKDICVKYFSMKGFLAPYVPGWDCHGLPVEHQLLKEMDITKNQIDRVDFRKKAYKYAMKFVNIQAKEFQRLGVFGDWDAPYLTLAKDYEADILFAFADLYEKGYIYKDLKPVNWCRKCETALAEAEVEYDEKKSPSVYVKFAADKKMNDKTVNFVIWTTTPWTLLANVAVALDPDFMYSFVDVGTDILVLASDLVDGIMKQNGIADYKVLEERAGREVTGEFKVLRHPFAARESLAVLAEYVTKEEGTGCVHTAPGHGQEDYLTGKKYGLPVLMPVDDAGRFTAEAGEFKGRDVLEANGAIIEKMRANGTLITSGEVTHSYPHCWRCREPIIFRATEQWFLRIDHKGLRNRMTQVVNEQVKWIPHSGRERMESMIGNRPDWCLSRQRYWGVPIPAFKCSSCGKTFTDAETIRKTAGLVKANGSNVWFEKEVNDLLTESAVCPGCGGTDFSKENDILDVWFDSGVSYKAVLEAREQLRFPADLYLEGSDQHRGWFQSALITSMADKECAPYRGVLTHGFVVDGEGKKMSKSVGNVIHPQDIMSKYGADIMRLWVAASDYESDIKLSPEILARLADGYRKIRNTFRFLLSNLYDFDPAKDLLPGETLTEIDKWILSRLHRLLGEVEGYYDNCEFYKVYRAVYNFCVYEVSAFYLDVSKDILYVAAPRSQERRSTQTAIFNILNVLVRITAPILSFTTEEIWGHINIEEKEESIHMADWPDISGDIAGWKDEKLDAKWQRILAIRGSVMKLLETKREEGLIASSLEAAVLFHPGDEKMSSFLHENLQLLCALFKVSETAIAEDASHCAGKKKNTDVDEKTENVPDMALRIGVRRARGTKCRRCWNYSLTVGKNMNLSDLCERCCNVILERSNNG